MTLTPPHTPPWPCIWSNRTVVPSPFVTAHGGVFVLHVPELCRAIVFIGVFLQVRQAQAFADALAAEARGLEIRYIGSVFLEKLAGFDDAAAMSFSPQVVVQLAGVVRQACMALQAFGAFVPVDSSDERTQEFDRLTLTVQAAVRAVSQYMQRRVRCGH